MCPGRFFCEARNYADNRLSFVSKFDIEFVEWTMPDGSPSDRAAKNDTRWSGAVGMPPDRDMKVRWKRLC